MEKRVFEIKSKVLTKYPLKEKVQSNESINNLKLLCSIYYNHKQQYCCAVCYLAIMFYYEVNNVDKHHYMKRLDPRDSDER